MAGYCLVRSSVTYRLRLMCVGIGFLSRIWLMSPIVEEDPLSRVPIPLSERGFSTVLRYVTPPIDVQMADLGDQGPFRGLPDGLETTTAEAVLESC